MRKKIRRVEEQYAEAIADRDWDRAKKLLRKSLRLQAKRVK